jgi:multiple sugar transport system substrate-binding protein
MKAFSRKASLVIIVLLVMVLVLAACNRNGNNEVTPDPTPAGQETPPPPPPAPEPADEQEPEPEGPALAGIHPVKDMGGRTITIGCWWENAFNFSGMGWEEPDPATADNYFIARKQWDNAQRVRAEFNVNFAETVLEHDAMLETLTATVMAGDPFADIVMLGGGMILSAVVGDLIIPLDSVNLPNSDILGPQVYGHTVNSFRDERWSFMPNTPFLDAFTIGINMDIINAIGAPNPQELFDRGLWTWDAMLDIMRTATRDTDGDGMFDQWGLAGQPGDIMFYFIGANDGPLVSADLNYYLDHPNTVEALEFMETIFRERLWEYDPVLGMEVGDWGRNFNAFAEGNSAFWPATTWAMRGGDLPFDFLTVPFPLGPSNTSGNTQLFGWRQSWTLTFGSDWDPADLLIIAEEFWSWPGDEPDLMPDEELGWPRGVWRTEQCVQHVFYSGLNMNNDIGMVVPQYNWVFGAFVNYFANQEMTVMQAIETHRGPSQELLDAFFR